MSSTIKEFLIKNKIKATQDQRLEIGLVVADHWRSKYNRKKRGMVREDKFMVRAYPCDFLKDDSTKSIILNKLLQL